MSDDVDDSTGAWQRYDLTLHPDGTISGRASTNDDNDDGYPDGGPIVAWNVRYRDRADMLHATSGGSHYGCSGVKVEVFVDGREVTR